MRRLVHVANGIASGCHKLKYRPRNEKRIGGSFYIMCLAPSDIYLSPSQPLNGIEGAHGQGYLGAQEARHRHAGDLGQEEHGQCSGDRQEVVVDGACHEVDDQP